MLLSDLPSELRDLVLPYLDARSLVLLSGVDSSHRTLVTRKSNAVWKSLHDRRWTHGRSSGSGSSGLGGGSGVNADGSADGTGADAGAGPDLSPEGVRGVFFDWMHEYARRHKLDATVQDRLVALASVPTDADDGNDPMKWVWCDLLLDGLDVVDRVREVCRLDVYLPGVEECDASELRDAARRALVAINRFEVFWRFKCLCESPGARSSRRRRPRDGFPPSPNIEDGAILLSRFYQTADQLLDQPTLDGVEREIRRGLDRLALELRARLRALHGGSNGGIDNGRDDANFPILSVLEEMQSLFAEESVPDAPRPNFTEDTSGWESPFRGRGDDYYNYKNSLVNCVISSRKGIPITLSVIYTAVVHRATGIRLDAVGLPGHFVLATPPVRDGDEVESCRFVDPYNGGRVLTLEECQQIVAGYGVQWYGSMAHPIPYEEVWQRMVRNLLNCHSMQAFGGEDEHGNTNAERAELQFCQKIAIPLRFLLTDLLFKVGVSQEVLVQSPPLYRRFC